MEKILTLSHEDRTWEEDWYELLTHCLSILLGM